MADEILKYENLVLSYASKFRYYYDMEDLKQVGMIGLKKAYEKYIPNSQTTFSTYAFLWIKGEILKYIQEDKTIKVSRDLVKLSQSIEEMRNVLRHKLMREPSLEEIALFSEIDISLIEEAELSKEFVRSLDYTLNEDDEGKELNMYDMVSYQEKGYDSEVLDLRDAIERLDENEQKIVQFRYFDDMTQSETARRLGVNQVKISRAEPKILQKLKKDLVA